jgi:RsiW-degrading membrane proteinase PrsW (M82 family)
MPIKLQCDCGKWLRMPDEAAGRRARCPACGNTFVVPQPEVAAPTPAPERVPVVSTDDELEFADNREADLAAAERAAARRRAELAAKAHEFGLTPKPKKVIEIPIGSTARPYRYLFLLLALLPLAWATVRPGNKDDVEDRVNQTVDDHPEIEEKVKAAKSVEELCAAMPGDRAEGALLAYDTYAHWGFALLSAAMFFGLVLLLFPPGHTKVVHLLMVCAFTGTLGIIVLLVFQWLAFHMPFFTPRGIISILLDIVWLIGQSYRLAMGDHGFLLSALGFTAGVGFCEETCKALPLIFKARSPDPFQTWRSAMIWGLISGVGFGVSEGITYSHDSYNGLAGGQIYLIRFISCVALHGIWAAATGINIFRRQDHFTIVMEPLDWIVQVGITIIVPMVLHGMYDTLLKQGYDWAALGVALASFGWLAYQIEMAKRRMDGLPAGYAA